MIHKIIFLIVTGLVSSFSISNCQLEPYDAVNRMMRGINIGNTMEPEYEGQWGNAKIVETLFDDYKEAGFTSVRIPIRWDKHTQTAAPFTVDAVWMDRVEQVVDWGLERGLFITINAHHEDWIKQKYSDPAQRARFDSIWSQISVRFRDKSDSLLFEIINEPKGLTQMQIDDLNERVLKIIRKTNPTRLVIFSGHEWSGADQLLSAAIPDTSDKYLVGYYHSYDPWPFALEGPGTYGSPSDISTTKARFDRVKAWSDKNHIPVILSEFGAVSKCEHNSRMTNYAVTVEQCLNHGIAFNVWDDGGDFQMLIRPQRKWNDLKDVVIYTYRESPANLKLSLKNDTNIVLTWTNRTTLNDSLILERKNNASELFVPIATLAPDTKTFYDSLLIPNKFYYYRLRSNIKDSIQIYSYPVRIKTNIPVYEDPNTFVKDKLSNAEFRIFPNPASTFLTLDAVKSNRKKELEIFDAMGRMIARESLMKESTIIRVEDLPAGNYIFRLSGPDGAETHSVVIK